MIFAYEYKPRSQACVYKLSLRDNKRLFLWFYSFSFIFVKKDVATFAKLGIVVLDAKKVEKHCFSLQHDVLNILERRSTPNSRNASSSMAPSICVPITIRHGP